MTVFLRKLLPLTLIYTLSLTSLNGCRKPDESIETSALSPAVKLHFTPEQASNAFRYVENFVRENTPRDAGTTNGARAAEWLCAELRNNGINAHVDRFTDLSPHGTSTFANVLGEVQGTSKDWIVLLSHFDTKSGVGNGFQGANDSGSSTGLLLELARIIHNEKPLSLNFIFGFMDGEECVFAYSENDGFHGSKRLSRQMKARNKSVKAVILMDMIGDRNLTITLPRNSTAELKVMALRAAETVGYRDKISLYNGVILDDHQAFLDHGYPAVNLIDFHFGSRLGQNDYWHTMEDTMDKISADSLLVTGRIVTEMVNQLSD
jgi:glutaminyl-peptide cyclotransferase